MDAKYNGDLQKAKARLVELMQQERAIQVEIAKQKGIVGALTQLANLTAPVELVSGLTDAVRTVLRATGLKPLTAAEVEEQVQALGVPRQQNLAASIHTTIRRLLEAGEIEKAGDPNSGGYRWKAPPMVRVGRLGYHQLPGRIKKDSK
jgi:hypothetical protein